MTIRERLFTPAALFLAAAFLLQLPAARASGSCSTPSFTKTPSVTEDFVNYRAVTLGDFNGDGKPDIAAAAIASGSSGTVRVYLGDGAGGFGQAANFQTGDSNGAWAITSGDFNRDGKLDLAVANNFSNSVSILLGNGNGGFAPGVMYGVGSSPRSIAVGDFNGDGFLDLATANFFSGNVTILFGDGAGGFGNARNVSVVSSPQYLKVADFNNDGRADIVVSSQGAPGISVLLGDGAGNFAPASAPFGIPNRVSFGIDAGDFDGDGIPDLASVSGNEVDVWRGDGTGHFGSPVSFAVGFSPDFVLATDFDSDGRLDLLVTNNQGNDVSILRGLGGDAFATQRIFIAGGSPVFAAAADLNGDGHPDAVVANITSLSILLGDGAGGFQAPEAYPITNNTFTGALSLVEGDYNSDGKIDLAVLRGDGITVLLNDGGKFHSNFIGPVTLSGQFGSIVAGDFNGDGKLDLAATDGAGGNKVTTFLGDGAGGFTRRSTTQVDTSPMSLYVADFNNDGFDDLVTPTFGGSSASILLGDGTGNFVRKPVAGFGVQTRVIAVGDFNGDGNADLVGSQGDPFSGVRVKIFLGDGAGNFTQSPNGVFTTSDNPQSLLVDDFNGDGHADLLVAVSTGITSTSGLFFLPGDGAGGLGPPVKTPGFVANSLVSGDFNGDGNVDIAGSVSDFVFVMLGDGGGNFGQPATFPVGSAPNRVRAADLNGDGRADLATANGSGDATILFNTCTSAPAPLPSLSVGDATVTEGDAGTTNATFDVRLSAPSSKTVSVSYYSAGLSATKGVDFQAVSGGLTFAPGVTSQTVTVPVVGDTLDEFDEKFALRLAFPLNATVAKQGEGTILDDDPPPAASIGDATITEGNSGTTDAIFTVSLSAPSGKPITLSFATADGTASAGSDYQPATGTLTFNPGETSKTLSVPVVGDTVFEPDESFFVNLGNPTNVTLARAQGVGTIINDDSSVQFGAAATAVDESAGSVQVTVTRTGVLTSGCAVDYATSDGTATQTSDYTLALGTLRFAPGEASKVVNVFITDDALVESPETFNITLSNPVGCSVGTPAAAVVQINSDDAAAGPNPIDATTFFVRQHYRDFLNREPDPSGFDFWTQGITSCGADAQCVAVKRINTSAAFFLSIEFQETGYLVERTYKTAYGDATGGSTFPNPHTLAVPVVRFTEFMRDTQEIGQGVVVGQGPWQQQIEDNKQSFALEFVTRSRFASAFPSSMTADQFVSQLDSNAGGVLSDSDKSQLDALFGGPSASSADLTKRAQALRQVAESNSLQQHEFDRAFVLMQYFGYLRRDPNGGPDADYTGYDFWLQKLNQFNGNFVQAEMVKAFLSSDEYRHRFGQ
jgi:hypothetical protein